MTVTNPANNNIFDGDGSTTVFGYTFQLPPSSVGGDIYIYVIDDEDEITPITDNFTLDLNAATITYPVTSGQSPLDPGVTALPVGWKLAVFRLEDLTQALNLATQGPFPAAGLMAALDKVTFISQQLQEQIDRCVKYPIGQAPTSTDVAAFIAAINAIVAPPPIEGTYAYCKAVAAQAPTTPRFAIVTDLGGGNGLCWYSGSVTYGDGGWFILSGGM